MRKLSLTEYQPTRLAPATLTQQEGTLLWRIYEQERGVLAVAFPSPRTDQQWQLLSQGWVGHIPVNPSLHLALQPKVPLNNLFGMLEYAYQLQSFHFLDGLVASDSLSEFYERLASVLARAVLQRGRTGLHRAYLPQQKRLPYVRGQLNLGETLTRPWEARLRCRYEEQTADIEDNQLLAWTLQKIAQSGLCSARVQPIVRRAFHSLQRLTTPTSFSADACVGRLYTRLNEDYRPLHALCRFFLEQSGPGHQAGPHTMVPFLVNMARLFELFVAEWLRLHLPQPWQLQAQERVTVGSGQNLQFDVDLVLYDQTGKAQLVLDTKYKVDGRIANSDVSQIVTYAQARGCQEAVLIYPAAQTEQLHVRIGEVDVRALAFPLEGDLEQHGQQLLANLLPERPTG